MFLLMVSVPVVAYLYFIIGHSFFDSKLTYIQYFQFSTLLAVIVSWGYQLYFWIQRNSDFFKSRCIKIFIDDYIPFYPNWIWIYSFLYYIGIGFVVVSISSLEQWVQFIFWGIMLLVIQTVFFFFLPCHTPIEWRKFEPDTISKKFMYFVQGYDSNKNCFPSMHCSLAMYISMLMYGTFWMWSFVFCGLIVVSCLFTKQHQILDTIPWVLLWYLVYIIFI